MAKKKNANVEVKIKSTKPPKVTIPEVSELIDRPKIESDFPHGLEVFNKMTLEERRLWKENAEKELAKVGVQPRNYGSAISAKEIDFSVLYNLAKMAKEKK